MNFFIALSSLVVSLFHSSRDLSGAVGRPASPSSRLRYLSRGASNQPTSFSLTFFGQDSSICRRHTKSMSWKTAEPNSDTQNRTTFPQLFLHPTTPQARRLPQAPRSRTRANASRPSVRRFLGRWRPSSPARRM